MSVCKIRWLIQGQNNVDMTWPICWNITNFNISLMINCMSDLCYCSEITSESGSHECKCLTRTD